MKKRYFILSLFLISLLFIGGCGGNQKINEDQFEEYQQLLREYYKAYQAGDFEKAITFFRSGFEYEEAGQTYQGEEVLKAAIAKNQHLRHRFTIRTMENLGNGILVTLDNSSYLLYISGIESYESQEFFEFKRGKIDSVITKINEDDFLYINRMIEASPGIPVMEQAGQIMIAELAADTEAYQKGLRQGDRLIMIDEVAVSDFELGANEAIYRLAGLRNTEVTLVAEQDDGQSIEVTLQRMIH